ncbi:MAG: flagellar basal body P-ring formation protein FlgA [Proteobacteria bacterium]|nr:flagellar basal body P-ring formation protein FlgA [Pseudomonadota bacterium]
MKEPVVKPVLDVKRMMMVVAMTACIVSHAFAATPKTESTVVGDRITLGDVFDGIKDNADYYLAPAPALGKSMVLNTADLTRISDAFNLGWVPDNNLPQVVIRRSSNTVDRYEIQAAVQEKLAAQMKGQKFDMELTDRSVSFRVPDATSKEVLVQNLMCNPAKGEFSATVAAAAAPDNKQDVRGKLYPISQLPVLKDPLRPGDVISAHDIDYVDMRAADITSSMVVDVNRLIGQTPRHGISAMKPIMAGDVQMPLLIKKGDLVTMLLKNNIVSLTAQGRAIDSGVEGEAIRVMNTSSKQVVSAVVTGPQVVSVKPTVSTM